MTVIRLVTTGRCEHAGLARALRRAFPQAEFDPGPMCVDGLTANRLSPRVLDTWSPKLKSKAEDALLDLINSLTRKGHADFAILVDDLEVANLGNVTGVMQFFAAVANRVASSETQRWTTLLRERCSVHLLAPMVEAYFFADSSALSAAGVGANVRVSREPGDVEQFRTNDPGYLAEATPAADGSLLFGSMPSRHPKHYLRYLTGLAYQETREGVAALQALSWGTVLSAPDETRLLRSMFEDISVMLDVSNPYPGETHPDTWPAHRGTLLRNV